MIALIRLLLALGLALTLGCDPVEPATPAGRTATAPPPAPVVSSATLRPAPPPSPAPVASATLARPDSGAFLGRYEGDRLVLRLEGEGSTRTGTLQLQKQRFPIEATVAGETLRGELEARGRRLPFQARRLPEGGLALDADGRTYRLNRPSGDFWSGRFIAADGKTTLVLKRGAEGARVGRIESAGRRYGVSVHTATPARIRGDLSDPLQPRASFSFWATRAQEQVTLVIQQDEGNLRTLILARE